MRPIGTTEHTSLTALVHLVAEEMQRDESAVKRDFLDRFHIENLALLRSMQFEQAVRYLVDQLPESAFSDAE